MTTKRRDEPGPDLPEHVVVFLRGLAREKFFGSVTLSFQNGKVLTIRTEQVHKVEDLGGEEKR